MQLLTLPRHSYLPHCSRHLCSDRVANDVQHLRYVECRGLLIGRLLCRGATWWEAHVLENVWRDCRRLWCVFLVTRVPVVILSCNENNLHNYNMYNYHLHNYNLHNYNMYNYHLHNYNLYNYMYNYNSHIYNSHIYNSHYSNSHNYNLHNYHLHNYKLHNYNFHNYNFHNYNLQKVLHNYNLQHYNFHNYDMHNYNSHNYNTYNYDRLVEVLYACYVTKLQGSILAGLLR